MKKKGEKADCGDARYYLDRRGNWTYISWQEGEALTGLVRAVPGVEELPLPEGGKRKWSLLGAHVFGTELVVYAALGNPDTKHLDRNYIKAKFDLLPC